MIAIDSTKLAPGDIVQIDPTRDTEMARRWGGCLIVVDEVKAFGIQGYMKVPAGVVGVVTVDQRAFIRVRWEEFEPVGAHVVWQKAEPA